MYQRALVSIGSVAIAVLVIGGLALAGLAQVSAAPSNDVVFQVGEAGSVSVRTDGPQLAIVDVDPNRGWEYDVATEPTTARVEFRSEEAGIDFDAALSSDRIVGRIRIVSNDRAPAPAKSDEDTAQQGATAPTGEAAPNGERADAGLTYEPETDVVIVVGDYQRPIDRPPVEGPDAPSPGDS